MKRPFLFLGGIVHSPYFIFVRRWRLSDEELLTRLGLAELQREDDRDEDGDVPEYIWLWVTHDSEWTHVMDNWLYTLWHMEDKHERIARLAADHDVFTCMVGDADDSYAFEYHRDGRLVRKRVVEPDRWPDTVKLTMDFGQPLPSESSLLGGTDPEQLPRLLQIASSLGIETDPEERRFRSYSLPQWR